MLLLMFFSRMSCNFSSAARYFCGYVCFYFKLYKLFRLPIYSLFSSGCRKFCFLCFLKIRLRYLISILNVFHVIRIIKISNINLTFSFESYLCFSVGMPWVQESSRKWEEFSCKWKPWRIKTWIIEFCKCQFNFRSDWEKGSNFIFHIGLTSTSVFQIYEWPFT